MCVQAQEVILLESDSSVRVYDNLDITDNYLDFPVDLFFKNNTSDSILINWRRELGANCPLEWDIITADQHLTYIPDINESQIPIPLTPADSHFIVRQIFLPRTVAGCCDVTMIFSLEGEPDNPIDTGYYHISINSDGCVISSLIDEMVGTIDLYPNPASNIIHVKNGTLIEFIEIFDMNGKQVLGKRNSNSSQLDLTSFARGVYFCKITSDSGNVVMKKIIKQ
jgi:hypothetical protein